MGTHKLALVGLVWFLAIFASISSAESATAQGLSDDYYPTDLGGQWLFKITENHSAKEASVVCDKTGKVNGLDCLHLKSSDSRLSYWVQKKDDGVYIVQTCRSVLGLADLEISFDPPIPILKFPMKSGDSWQYDGWGRTFITSKKLHVSYQNKGLKTIRLNQKSIRVFEVVSRYQVDKDPAQEQVSWYAKGLGFVGSRSKDCELSLEKFNQSQVAQSVYDDHEENP